MTRLERKREAITDRPDDDHWRRMELEGWRPSAIEWVRTASGDGPDRSLEEPPYGLRVCDDCRHLEQDDDEVATMARILAMLSDDVPLSRIAERLNGDGRRDRDGAPWSQTTIFGLLPRVIEVAPRIYAGNEWREHRPHAVG